MIWTPIPRITQKREKWFSIISIVVLDIGGYNMGKHVWKNNLELKFELNYHINSHINNSIITLCLEGNK